VCGLSTVDRAVGVEKGRDVAGNGFESDGVEERRRCKLRKKGITREGKKKERRKRKNKV
jgi:hypothetical protein